MTCQGSSTLVKYLRVFVSDALTDAVEYGPMVVLVPLGIQSLMKAMESEMTVRNLAVDVDNGLVTL